MLSLLFNKGELLLIILGGFTIVPCRINFLFIGSG